MNIGVIVLVGYISIVVVVNVQNVSTCESTGEYVVTHAFDSESGLNIGGDGLRAGGKFTGLIAGDNITKVWYKLSGALGDIRVSVYAADGAGEKPLTLLAQSSNFSATIGENSGTLISPAIIPLNGKIWTAVQTSSAFTDFYFEQGSSGDGFSGEALFDDGAPNPWGIYGNEDSKLWTQITAVGSGGSTMSESLSNACNLLFNNAGTLFVIVGVLLLLLVIPLIRGVVGTKE